MNHWTAPDRGALLAVSLSAWVALPFGFLLEDCGRQMVSKKTVWRHARGEIRASGLRFEKCGKGLRKGALGGLWGKQYPVVVVIHMEKGGSREVEGSWKVRGQCVVLLRLDVAFGST